MARKKADDRKKADELTSWGTRPDRRIDDATPPLTRRELGGMALRAGIKGTAAVTAIRGADPDLDLRGGSR